jgi:hypothetical protein
MSIKVIVTAIGQHVIADIKQIENKDTEEVVGYWLENPRVIAYSRKEDSAENVSIGFVNYCLVSDEQAFSMKADHVVSILEPRADVAAKYVEVVVPAPTDVVNDESSSTADPEGGSDAGKSDGAA